MFSACPPTHLRVYLQIATSLWNDYRVFIVFIYIDYFTIQLHSPKSKHLPAVRAMQGDCQWGLKNGGNSRQSREPKSYSAYWSTKKYIRTFFTGTDDLNFYLLVSSIGIIAQCSHVCSGVINYKIPMIRSLEHVGTTQSTTTTTSLYS